VNRWSRLNLLLEKWFSIIVFIFCNFWVGEKNPFSQLIGGKKSSIDGYNLIRTSIKCIFIPWNWSPLKHILPLYTIYILMNGFIFTFLWYFCLMISRFAKSVLITVELGFNDHGYNEFTDITNNYNSTSLVPINIFTS